MANTPFDSFDKFDQDNKFPHKSSRKILDDMREDFDGVQSIVAGPGITVDSTDPSNPIITAIFSGSGNGGGSGGLWVKGVEKQNIESVENDIMYKGKTLYGGVTGLAGNALNIRLFIAALPGSNSEGASIQAYVVPGGFIPSPIVPFPEAIDTPVNAVFAGMYVNDEDNTEEDPDLEQVDHMVFSVDLTFTAFQDGKVQIVVLSDSGAYVLLEYTEENIAHLLTANITTLYSEIDAYRTGFTAGDEVTLAFTADADVYSIFVWPFDATSHSMGWEPVEYVLPSGTMSGTVTITIAVTAPNLNTGNYEGTLRVSASRYGQATLGIETTSEFVFDQRTPIIGLNTSNLYNYNGSQTAMKLAETCVVTIPTFLYAHQFTVSLVSTAIELTVPNPFAVVAGAGTFTVQRTVEDFTGIADGSVTALNSNNGKTFTTVTNFILVDVEGVTYADPVLTVNSGNPVFSYAEDPISISLSIISEVKLSAITGAVTLDGITITSPWFSQNGYNWTAQGITTDAAIRGTFPATVGSLTSAADVPIGAITGEFTISGFTERAVTITTPFSTTLNMTGIVDIDYGAGLTVKDLSNQELVQGIGQDYTVAGNVITFLDPTFYNANASGTMYVYVAQTPEPI